MTRTAARTALGLAAALVLLLVGASSVSPGPGDEEAAVDALRGLRPLVGTWAMPSGEGEPTRIVHDYAWTVGGNALRVREGYDAGRREEADLDGIVLWHPGTRALELTAVAGHGAGEGRVFRGTYRVLDDGRIERVYDVHYRTLADTPGEELGGTTRRYREVYTIEGDALEATLEWWRDGAWQAFGPGRYALVRAG